VRTGRLSFEPAVVFVSVSVRNNLAFSSFTLATVGIQIQGAAPSKCQDMILNMVNTGRTHQNPAYNSIEFSCTTVGFPQHFRDRSFPRKVLLRFRVVQRVVFISGHLHGFPRQVSVLWGLSAEFPQKFLPSELRGIGPIGSSDLFRSAATVSFRILPLSSV